MQRQLPSSSRLSQSPQFPNDLMLSKLFISARSLFNPTSQTSSTKKSSIQEPTEDMVTTRGQSASQEGVHVEDPIVLDIPRSSRKRSRKSRDTEDGGVGDEVLATPAKKNKVLPVREKDENGLKTSTRVAVEIPVSKMASELQEIKGHAEDDNSGNDSEDGAGEDEEEVVEGDCEESDAIAWEKPEVLGSESEGGSEPTEEVTKATPDLSKQQNKHTNQPKISATTPFPAQPKHKRFGSEDLELEPEFFSTAVEVQDSDKESSDDDAPEVVGAQDALENAQSIARDAAKAVGEQETAIRKKRQERDATLKKQAETAAKKRERAEKKAAKKKAKEMNRDHENGDTAMLEVQDMEDTAPAKKKTVINSSNLPDLLPDEYLQDDEETESLADLDLDVTRTKPKRMKFSDLVEKKPKDRKVGSTTYRVSESRNKLLAPKSSFHAKNTKESWLKGRGPIGKGGVRKVASGGFFKK